MENIISPIISLYVMIPITVVLVMMIVINLVRSGSAIKRKVFMSLRHLLIVALIFCVNLRIMAPVKETKINTKNLDVLFVIDNTLSMWADDGINGDNRMDDCISCCQDIMSDFEGANFAVIQFDNYGQVLAPFTQDTTIINDVFRTMSAPSPDYALGTSLDYAIDPMEELLSSSDQKENRKTVVFFMSDGEANSENGNVEGSGDSGDSGDSGNSDNSGDSGDSGDGAENNTNESTAGTTNATTETRDDRIKFNDSGKQRRDDSEGVTFADLSEYIDNGAVIGFGTKAGGNMRVNGDYITDENGDRAVTKIDEDSLQSLADDLTIDYIYCDDEESIVAKDAEILRIVEDVISDSDLVTYTDTYYYFLYPLLFMLVLELFFVMRKRAV